MLTVRDSTTKGNHERVDMRYVLGCGVGERLVCVTVFTFARGSGCAASSARGGDVRGTAGHAARKIRSEARGVAQL